MAYLGQEFDANQVEPSKPREVIPPNWYKAIIDASDVKPTKKAQEAEQYGTEGAGDRLLAFTFKIVEGPHDGTIVFNNLNIVNVNPTAQEIANRDLSAICHAVGKMKVKDSSELHNRPLFIKVDVERKEGQNPRNIIKGYKSLSEAADLATSASTGGAVATVGAASSVKATPAWAKK